MVSRVAARRRRQAFAATHSITGTRHLGGRAWCVSDRERRPLARMLVYLIHSKARRVARALRPLTAAVRLRLRCANQRLIWRNLAGLRHSHRHSAPDRYHCGERKPYPLTSWHLERSRLPAGRSRSSTKSSARPIGADDTLTNVGRQHPARASPAYVEPAPDRPRQRRPPVERDNLVDRAAGLSALDRAALPGSAIPRRTAMADQRPLGTVFCRRSPDRPACSSAALAAVRSARSNTTSARRRTPASFGDLPSGGPGSTVVTTPPAAGE